jgi:hypothetical protein
MPRQVREQDANWALVLGVLAMLLGILGPFAVRAGLRSLGAINRSHGRLRGTGSALFGVFAGAVSTLFLVFGVGWFLVSALR